MRITKTTIKHYLNSYLKPIQEREKEFRPLYILITSNRKNTQIRSLTNAYVTKSGLDEYNESGKISRGEVLTETDNLGDVLKTEQHDFYNIAVGYLTLYDYEVNLNFAQTDFARIYTSVQQSAKAFISPYIWEYAKEFMKDKTILQYINTHRTFAEIAEGLAISKDIATAPEFMEMWDFVEKYVPSERKILDWYLDEYGKVVNKNEVFDKIFRNALFSIYPTPTEYKTEK